MEVSENKFSKREKQILVISLVLLGSFSGACVGFIVWSALRGMSIGIDFLWSEFPTKIFGSNFTGVTKFIFYVVTCSIGGLLIGLFQRKHGIYPETLEEVMHYVKQNNTYHYQKTHILLVAALLPLIFGASLGPEAGLSGVIVGLSCFIGDKLKYKGEQIKELTEASLAACLTIVFNAPFYGIANDIESEIETQEIPEEKRIFSAKTRKKVKNVILICSVISGMLVIKFSTSIFGGGFGISRYTIDTVPTLNDWKWFIPFLIIGLIGGVFYDIFRKITFKLSEKVKENRVLTCLIGGIVLGIIGYLVPFSMFSGEHEMSEIMVSWEKYGVGMLMLIGFFKLFLTNFCINFGWKGGNIFPIIFSGCALGYSLVVVSGINPVFGVCVTVASICGYIMKKPVAVIAILFLCFPIRLIIPLSLSSYIGSIIGEYFSKKNK